MKQTGGGITVDRGYRPGGSDPPDQSTSKVVDRPEPTQAVLSGYGVYGASDWILPGFGEPGPRCGEYYPEAVCETCGEPEFGTHQCGRRECPDCWGSWAKDAAIKRTVRLQARRLQEPNDYRRQAAHATISPDAKIRTVRQFKDWRSKAGELAQEHGFRGADVVGHPFRTTEEANAMYARADPDVGKWVWLRENHPERLTLDHSDPLVVWSPHYHVVGLTSPDMEEGDGDGYVYNYHDSLDRLDGRRDRSAHESAYGTYRYLLSHPAFHREEGHNTVVGYGDLSNAKFHEFRPSDGKMNAIERAVREAVETAPVDDDDATGEPSDEQEPCPQDGCDGFLVDVWEIRSYLDRMNPPPEIEQAMLTAYRWRMGKVEPPPGLKAPDTLERARESFAVLLDQA